jgi:hypothetical protein
LMLEAQAGPALLVRGVSAVRNDLSSYCAGSPDYAGVLAVR